MTAMVKLLDIKKVLKKKPKKGELVYVPNLQSIGDESEENFVPAIWYVYSPAEDKTIKVCLSDEDLRLYEPVWCYMGIETPEWMIDNNHVELYDEFNNIIPNIAVDREKLVSIIDKIIGLASEYICDDPDKAEMEMVSPGYPATPWDKNGDPGEPGEGPEWDIKCPYCGANAPSLEEGRCRCDECKKWMYISYT